LQALDRCNCVAALKWTVRSCMQDKHIGFIQKPIRIGEIGVGTIERGFP